MIHQHDIDSINERLQELEERIENLEQFIIELTKDRLEDYDLQKYYTAMGKI